MNRLIPVALTILLAPAPADAQAPAKKRTTYDEHVLPVLKDKCLGCHSTDKKRGGLNVANYTSLMQGGSSGASVKPGDPDNSLLYKLMAHTAEPIMPPKSAKPAANDPALAVVHKWITDGAPENSGSKVVMVERPKTDFTLSGVAKGKPAVPPMPPPSLRLDPVVRAARDTAVTALAANPWSPLVAVGGQKQVVLYNAETQALLGVLPFPEGTPNVLKFSRNGSLLLAGGGRAGKAGKVVIWSVAKGERLFAVGDETDCVLAADISPDQTQIALGGPSKMLRVYSAKDGKLLHEVKKHTDWITSLEFSPDGVLLATADRSGGLFVWEANTAREYFALRGPTGAVTEVSWRPDSNVVAAASEDTTVRLFEMENGNQVRTWGGHGGGSLGVSYGMDGRLTSAGRDRTPKLWDGNGGLQRAFEAMPDLALRSVLTHDSRHVVAADWSGAVTVWQTADGKRVGALSANPPTVAELLAGVKKTVEDRQKARDAVAAVAKASADAVAKANADVAAAQKLVADTAAAAKATEQRLAQGRANLTNAQAALDATVKEARAKEVLAKELTEAAIRVKAEADRAKDNAALQTAGLRALSLAGQASAELVFAQKAMADMQGAVRAVEPTLAPLQAAHAAAVAATQNAPKAVPGLVAAQQNAMKKAAADAAALGAADAALNEAKASLARLTAPAVAGK
ncbi:MAG: c-type cytochrome domain-containing protein [Gemmataceae bacterium]